MQITPQSPSNHRRLQQSSPGLAISRAIAFAALFLTIVEVWFILLKAALHAQLTFCKSRMLREQTVICFRFDPTCAVSEAY
jgi:hypothetical protein